MQSCFTWMVVCPQRVHLDISIGEHAVDYAQIAAKEKLNELQLRIRQLLDQIEHITKEQAYQRVRQSIMCDGVKVIACSGS